MSIDCRLIQRDDREGAIKCMSESFFENDVLGTALNISLKDWIDFSSGVVDKSINSYSSFVAVNGRDVVGVHLSYDFESYAPQDYEVVKSFLPISSLMNKLYEDYEVDGRILHFSYVGVDSNFSRKGVAFEMAKRNISFAEDKKYDKIILEATSPYSQRNVSKLGFKKMNEIFYDDFEYRGVNVFSDRKGSCMLMELNL